MPRSGLAPKGTALAKLEGRIFYADNQHHHFEYYMLHDSILLGRSDPGQLPDNPLAPAQQGVHVGLGDSNKLSRTHARIQFDPDVRAYRLHCLGKNGLTATLPNSDETVVMTPETKPVVLKSRTLVQMGECMFCFMLPLEYPPTPKKRRDWNKTETMALRTLMTRFGYGRWTDIIKAASGKLAEREPEELVPVARRFIARCYIHAHAGIEQRAVGEMLREDFDANATEESINADVETLVQEAKDAVEPNEKRKFVRWTRKLRLLRRLRDVHDHSSLDRLRAGELRVLTPKPSPSWTDADDADLVLGSYKHGLLCVELIRGDPQLGFHDRYLPVPSNRKSKGGSKPKTPANGNGDEEEDHEEEDDGEYEEEDLGGGSAEKSKMEPTPSRDLSPSESADLHELSDSVPSVKAENVPMKTESAEPVRAKPEPEPAPAPVKSEDMIVDTAAAGTIRESNDAQVKVEAAVTTAALNDDGQANNSEKAEPELVKVMFPTSEALMKRLKSVINACSKEYDRDVKERRRQTEAQNRAQQKKQVNEQRRRDKEAEKQRVKVARKIARSQPFSKKDAVEFEKALANFGLELNEDGTHDWDSFIAKVPNFQNKFHETLENAFNELNTEAHRLVDLARAKEDDDNERMSELSKLAPSTMFTQLTLDRAEKVLDRLNFFRTLRSEIMKNPATGEILRGCKKSKDLPLWWKSTYDKALLWGVAKHGMNAWENLTSEDPFIEPIREHEERYADDPKNLKKGGLAKRVAQKRANLLVAHYRSKSTDSHYQQQAGSVGNTPAGEHGLEKRESDESMSDAGEKAAPETAASAGDWNGHHHANGSGNGRRAVATHVESLVDRNGHMVLPAVVSEGLYLLELGEIVEAEQFYTDKVLYPVGYRAVRQLKDEAFLCEIRSMPDNSYPVFRVSRLHGFQTHDDTKPMWESSDVVSEDLDVQKAWMTAVNRFVKGVRMAAGVERFGLFDPTVVHYMQQLPRANRCTGYVFREYGVPAAHAAAHTQAAAKESEMYAAMALRNAKRGAPGSEALAMAGGWADAYDGRKKQKTEEWSASAV